MSDDSYKKQNLGCTRGKKKQNKVDNHLEGNSFPRNDCPYSEKTDRQTELVLMSHF